MERSSASDGGRVLRSAAIALGSLIWTAPLIAQPAPDPLAPLPSPSQDAAVPPIATFPSAQPAVPSSTAQQPAIVSQVQVQPAPLTVPKDWRGVFDAIDAGSWASAQAGIAALPRSVLTPLATAELYTA